MAGILDPTANSRANIEAFVDSIDDDAMRELLLDHLNEILAIGRAGGISSAESESQNIYASLSALVDETSTQEL